MNKFNDIIEESKVVEIPGFFKSMWDYGDIIEKAFALTGGLLSFDDFNIQKDGKHFKITVLSKNTKTQFKLDRLENNQLDKNNLIRGLNRTLTDIFYLGDERFYDVSGKVIPFGIGFISNKQKRHLLKAGLIGIAKTRFNTGNPIRNTIKQNIEKEKQEKRKETKTSITGKKTIQNKSNPFQINQNQKYLEKKLNNKSNSEIFDIIHHPHEQTSGKVNVAKKIAIKKGIPIFSERDYALLVDKYDIIIDNIAKLALQKHRNNAIHQILVQNNINRDAKFIILTEAQRRINKNLTNPLWKTILKIVLILIALIFILSRL